MRPTFMFIALLAAASGCVTTEVGNPQTDSDVAVAFTGFDEESTDPPVLMRQSFIFRSGVVFTEAWLSLPLVELRFADDCAGDDSRLEGATFVELVSGQELPALPTITSSAQQLCRLEMEVGPTVSVPTGVPEDLAGASILIRGTNADGVPFELRDTLEERFRLDGPYDLDGDESFLVGFALADWLRAADVAAVADEDPVLIDIASRPAVIEGFRERVSDSADLFRDEGGDGLLD